MRWESSSWVRNPDLEIDVDLSTTAERCTLKVLRNREVSVSLGLPDIPAVAVVQDLSDPALEEVVASPLGIPLCPNQPFDAPCARSQLS